MGKSKRAGGALAFCCVCAFASEALHYASPAGKRYALRRPGAASILPGGRIIAPLGQQQITGPGAFGLAISPNGRHVLTANGGPNRYSLSILRGEKSGWLVKHVVAPRNEQEETGDGDDDWRSVFMGLAFSGNGTAYASEGNSGFIRRVSIPGGDGKQFLDLDQEGFSDSYSGDLAIDEQRELLYAVDQANFRLAVIDLQRKQVVSSVRLGRLPFAIALSPDKRKAYVTNIGLFEYRPLPGADPAKPRETGIEFPAFGFPSPEALAGVRRQTAQGPIDVPPLGDPNVREANSVAVVDVSNPSAPRVEAFIRTGLPVGESSGGSSPSGVLATADRVYVTNGHNDTVTVIDRSNNTVTAEIPIRIPGLEKLRGVLPIGMGYHEASGWLLVAHAGINAVGVIDTRKMALIGLLPVGWFPTRVLVDRDTVYVANAKGHGTGPNAVRQSFDSEDSFSGTRRRGTVSIFPLPGPSELPAHTAVVLQANGFRPVAEAPAPIPAALKHVVLIVKENRTFDEVFGDIATAGRSAVNAVAPLARFGRFGYVDGQGKRFSLQNINVTPNHHALALKYAFSDNFYADAEVSVDGHHWLVGSYPNAWTESSLMAAYGGQKDFRISSAPGRLSFAESNSSVHPEEIPEAGTIWHHFDRHKVTFRNFGEGFELAGSDEGPGLKPTGARFLTNVPMPDPLYRNTSRTYPGYNMNIPDQYRASQFIAEIEEKYVRGGEPFPQFIFIHLPNDHMAAPRPQDGYPYAESFVADNDYALGRIVEFLSNTKWWREMAIFITEDDAQGGRDHVDSHRTVLIAAGPYVKSNYVSHVNSSFPGLLKTIFRILRLPPLNLFDAAASDLADVFTLEPDFSPYENLPVDARLFDPEKARAPLDPVPGPRMDDPAFLRRQHRR
jgi:YVTN family beta-propeller protein